MRRGIKVTAVVTVCFGLMVLTAVGCATILEEPAPAAAVMEAEALAVDAAVETADPEGAIEAVYASIEEYSAEELDEEAMEELIGIRPSQLQEHYAYYSDAKAGLADIIIVKPYESGRNDVREKLYQYKEQRVQEFENYNILDAHTIAQNAVVYDQGAYVILLMLADNEEAKILIDGYMPQ